MTTLNLQVGASADDGYARMVTGAAYQDATAWLFAGNVSSQQFGIWLRFTGVSDLGGNLIQSATLTIEGWANANGSGVLQRIFGEDAAAPTAPTTALDWRSRTRTTAFVDWDEDSVQDVATTAPDLATIIQELADSYDPTVIQLFIHDDGSGVDDYNQWKSYDDSSVDAAQLDIDYIRLPVRRRRVDMIGPY